MECVKGRPQPFGVEIRKDHINFAVQVPTENDCQCNPHKKETGSRTNRPDQESISTTKNRQQNPKYRNYFHPFNPLFT